MTSVCHRGTASRPWASCPQGRWLRHDVGQSWTRCGCSALWIGCRYGTTWPWKHVECAYIFQASDHEIQVVVEIYNSVTKILPKKGLRYSSVQFSLVKSNVSCCSSIPGIPSTGGQNCMSDFRSYFQSQSDPLSRNSAVLK